LHALPRSLHQRDIERQMLADWLFDAENWWRVGNAY
jgi:hypothetical protein